MWQIDLGLWVREWVPIARADALVDSGATRRGGGGGRIEITTAGEVIIPPARWPIPGLSAEHMDLLRRTVLERWTAGMDVSADWHHREGCPLYSDGSVATFSRRGWGDLAASALNAEMGTVLSYIHFY